tara:strand:- start:1584 stop:3338 length:1755 start_codon:yes stop_codon:yes gene_type:complete
MGVHHSGRMVELPFYARVSKPERIFSGFLTIIVRNANDGNEATDDFLTRYNDHNSGAVSLNIDNYAPFDGISPGAGFEAGADTFGENLLLTENGGTNDLNSTFDTADATAFEWVNIDTGVGAVGDTTGIVGTASGSGQIVFTPQASGASANEEGIKLVQSASMGTTGLSANHYVWRTYSGRRYRVSVTGIPLAAMHADEAFYIEVVFADSTTFKKTFSQDTWETTTLQTLDFVIPINTNLDEIRFYILDPANAAHTYIVSDVKLQEIIPDKARTDFGQSIGDYDVLVYHVTGCCHLKAFVQPYQADGTADYYDKTDLGGYPNTDNNTWAKYIDHPACQNFVKFTLVSRHNNAYDNQTWNPSPVYLETDTINVDDKSIHIFNMSTDPVNTATYWNYGLPETAMGDDYNQSMIDRDTYILKDASTVSLQNDPPSAGITRRREQVFSTSSASHVKRHGVDGGTSSLGRDMRSNTAGLGTVLDRGNNTFFAPVHGVDIFATHPFVLSPYVAGGFTAQTHTTHGALVRANTHDTSFWQLVVNIKLLAFNSGAAIDTDDDYEFFKNRININYQPSGETQNIIFSPTRHTS